MSDPLSLLPLALAAGGGRLSPAGTDSSYEAQQLVAAGLTLLQRSAPLVRALGGRRSAILLSTSPAFITALAASEGRGAVLINPLASDHEIAFQCRDANVGAVFTTEAFAARLPDLPCVLLDDAPRTARVMTPGRTQEVDLGSHHGLSLEGERDVAGAPDEAVIVYTSAMRGTPLGAVLTHANLLANARSTAAAAHVTPYDRVLALLPYSHLFGFTVTGSAPLLVGAHVLTMDRFHPIRAAELLASAGISVLVGVPAVFHALLAAIERRDIRLRDSALRLCMCGGAPLPSALQARWAEVTGAELREGYGLTEAAPVCLFNAPGQPNSVGALGRAMPGVDVAVLPPTDYSAPTWHSASSDPLPHGTPGEICVAGDNVSPGYLHGEGGLPRRGRWLCTGDQGTMSADGTVTFLRVLKPMFTRNGFNIYPREIERAVTELDGVECARVAAIPDPIRENDVALAYSGSATPDEVKAWCESRLSAYKQPSMITRE